VGGYLKLRESWSGEKDKYELAKLELLSGKGSEGGMGPGHVRKVVCRVLNLPCRCMTRGFQPSGGQRWVPPLAGARSSTRTRALSGDAISALSQMRPVDWWAHFGGHSSADAPRPPPSRTTLITLHAILPALPTWFPTLSASLTEDIWVEKCGFGFPSCESLLWCQTHWHAASGVMWRRTSGERYYRTRDSALVRVWALGGSFSWTKWVNHSGLQLSVVNKLVKTQTHNPINFSPHKCMRFTPKASPPLRQFHPKQFDPWGNLCHAKRQASPYKTDLPAIAMGLNICMTSNRHVAHPPDSSSCSKM